MALDKKTVAIATLRSVTLARVKSGTDPRSFQRNGTRVSGPSCDSSIAGATRNAGRVMRRRTDLQVGVVDGERRAEETLDDGHHRLRHVFLQGGISMGPIRGGVAHLG